MPWRNPWSVYMSKDDWPDEVLRWVEDESKRIGLWQRRKRALEYAALWAEIEKRWPDGAYPDCVAMGLALGAGPQRVRHVLRLNGRSAEIGQPEATSLLDNMREDRRAAIQDWVATNVQRGDTRLLVHDLKDDCGEALHPMPVSNQAMRAALLDAGFEVKRWAAGQTVIAAKRV